MVKARPADRIVSRGGSAAGLHPPANSARTRKEHSFRIGCWIPSLTRLWPVISRHPELGQFGVKLTSNALAAVVRTTLARSLVLGDHECSWSSIPHGIANDMFRYLTACAV